ncbi:hypothetical protein JHK82_019065 [Glycine max]|nr:hypothetical protein JHK85_019504 [Glycine max]KAG5143370.1 hypothetical protein JHK82_019065 [Glycine max]
MLGSQKQLGLEFTCSSWQQAQISKLPSELDQDTYSSKLISKQLANTRICVIVSVPNDQLLGIGKSNATAANWVTENVIAHVPATNITAICVGSEVLTTLPNAAPILVSAINFIHSALVAANLDQQIKIYFNWKSSIQQCWT